MQFHYYVLNYAMCGDYFLPDVQKPLSAYGFVNHLEKVWDGIGSWRA